MADVKSAITKRW